MSSSTNRQPDRNEPMRRDRRDHPVHGDEPPRQAEWREPRPAGDVVAEQRARFGGMKFGACFFGWLTATGTAVLLTALLAAIGAGVGLSSNTTAGQVTNGATANAQTIGLAGGIGLVVLLLISYFCGGYVAGRMARFNGARQGFGVWLWAVIIAIVVAIVTAIAGSKYNLLGTLNGFPRIPVDEGSLATGGIIAAVVAALAALVGAILGGLAGMRFHRRVDRATLDTAPVAHDRGRREVT